MTETSETLRALADWLRAWSVPMLNPDDFYTMEDRMRAHADAMEKLEQRVEALELRELEATWLITHSPPDDLGEYTQTLRRKWVARRDAWLAALAAQGDKP